MFGGQDNTATPQGISGAPQDDPLSGVTDLVGGSTATPSASSPDTPQPNDLPAPPEPAHHDEPEPAASDAPGNASNADGDEDNGLMDIKQQALQQLSPLIGHLDQTPVEKFRTTMMLIQASDNKALLKDAFEAAQAIEDEKTRAQALLDVVNEINYFTQGKEQ